MATRREPDVRLRRIYEPAGEDGLRVLIDRLWPRGVRRDGVRIDAWLKDLAPSSALRRWFGHDPAKWEQFKVKYWEELRHNSSAVETLREHIKKSNVTFVYAARDEKHNGALALQEFLEQL